MMEYEKNSNWIWNPSWSVEDKDCPRITLFRKEIELEEKPYVGKIQISADTRYKLYVNDRLVEVGPSRGDHQVWFYDKINILPYLKKGKNIIAVSVLRYPEDPVAGNHGMFRTFMPGLYVVGKIEDMNGREYGLTADSSWKCKIDRSVCFYREEERFAPLIIHERARGNKEIFGWRTEEYDDRHWEKAKPYIKKFVPEAVSPGNLKPRTIPFMYRKKRQFLSVMALENDREKETFVSTEETFQKTSIEKASVLAGDSFKQSLPIEEEWASFLKGERKINIPAYTKTVVEIDAGEEMTGYIKMALFGGENTKISLLYSEAYVQDGFVGPEKIPVKADRLDRENGHLDGYTDYYDVQGIGEENRPEIYEPYWFRTFRFIRLQIETDKEELILQSLDYEETGYPLKISTRVQTSDKSLEPIWEISERTLRRCMHETYEDCPFYEQLQYIMDARAQILYTYSVSADDRLARKCMDDLRRSQRYDGLLNCSYPNCNTNVIPGFSIYYILIVYDHMMYFGDRSLVANHMPAIAQILHYFERHLTKEGYVEKVGGINMEARFWSFIDWASEWNDTSGMPTAGLKGPLTMETLLYIYGLLHAAKLAEFLGRIEEANQYRDAANKAKQAIRKSCIGENGMIQDGPGVEEYSQHCQVFGILTHTVDMETGKRNLLRTIEEEGFVQCTVAMRFYLFRALEETGLYAYTDRYWDAWRNMIKMHCTTCVESEAYSRSECHAWGALILYELPSITLGVRPAAPGYKKVKIAPVPGYLTSASGTVKTPVGEISVSWRIKDGNFKIDYEVPQDIEVVR